MCILRRIRFPIAGIYLLSDAGLVERERGLGYARVLEYLQKHQASERRSCSIVYAHRKLKAVRREGEKPLAERFYLLHRLPWSISYILIWYIFLCNHVVDEGSIFGKYIWQGLESS